jgi:hypothetical protein
MGIDTASVLIVGRPREDFEEWLEKQREEPGNEDLDDYDLLDGVEYASPYYDSDPHDRIYGVAVAFSPDYTAKELGADLSALIAAAHVEFADTYGMAGKLYLSPHVT